MNTQRQDLFARCLFVAWMFVAGAVQAVVVDTTTLRNGTQPGVVLRHNYHYKIDQDVTIDARANPGLSAVRVPVGSAVIIEVAENRTLTVFGGPGQGQIPGGAGIEVPLGAKLVLCGKGKVGALGGAAANGGMGYGGRPGERGIFASPTILKDSELPCPREDIPAPDTREGVFSESFCSNALAYGRIGTGGFGGSGGGGAGAGIGGRGGNGGVGGFGGLGRLVVSRRQYDERRSDYADCAKYFGIQTPYVYGAGDILCDGERGLPGAVGGNGCAVGEIILAGEIKVEAECGASGLGGGCGPYGATYRCYDSDDNPDATAYTAAAHTSTLLGAAGLFLGAFPVTAGVVGAASSIIAVTELFTDAAGVTDRARLAEMLWYCGGGGGGGGAGGAAAPFGIGPGGAGGGGGGGGGAGFFLLGAGSVYTVGMIAKPDLSVPPLPLSGHGGKGGQADDDSRPGADASPANRGEVEHTDRDQAGDVPYNSSNGRLGAWSWQRGGDNWAWSGVGADGGVSGQVNTNTLSVLCSQDASVSGFPKERLKPFSGALSYSVTFKDGDAVVAQSEFICGTIVDIAPVSAMEKVVDGRTYYFSGYFTRPNGGGAMYFDRFCCPANDPSITSDLTLYAHWTADNPDCGIATVLEVRADSFQPGDSILAERIYHFKENVTVVNPAGAGLRISAGRTVFYIPKGIKASFTGADGTADGQPGYPGIEVPSTATLVIIGEGELFAQGGKAVAGGNGANGEAVTKKDRGNIISAGNGGNGGTGGAGGAAGIGGAGGDASGAVGGTGAVQEKDRDMEKKDYDKWLLAGVSGSAGGGGGAGETMGCVYVLGTSVTALSGAAAVGGKNGVDGGRYDGSGQWWDYIFDRYIAGSGGGGAGGGGGGSAAFGIGGGGGAGGGGGGGGSGSYWHEQVSSPSDYNPCGFGGRGGGAGLTGGGAGADGGTYGTNAKGGAGGAAGAAGQQGGDGEFYASVDTAIAMSHAGADPRLADLAYGHPALQRTLTFMCEGREVAKVAAQVGMSLPILPTNCTGSVRGYVFAGAYAVEGGVTNWWYGLGGEALRRFEGTEDVTLTAVFEPDTWAMATLPSPRSFTYTGSNCVAFVASEQTGCEYVSGVTNATAAGVYTYDVRLRDGKTIWSDLKTNEVRTVEWAIFKAAITNDWKDNVFVYDWTKSPDENRPSLGFDLPDGVTVEFVQTRRLDENLFSLEARISGGANYLDRTLYGAWQYPQMFKLGLTSGYPWDTKVEVAYGPRDYSGREEEKEAFVRNYGDCELVASVLVKGDGRVDSEEFVDFDLGHTVGWLVNEAGQRDEYTFIDLKDIEERLPARRTNSVPIYLSIDGRRFVAGSVSLDLTAEPFAADGTNWPHYVVHDYRDIFPVNCSWRFVDDVRDRTMSQSVKILLGVGYDGQPAEKFEPRTASQPITDRSVAWRPSRAGEYVLEHEVYDREVRTGYRRAYFTFDGQTPDDDPTRTNVVVSVRRRGTDATVGYASLKAAVADLRYGDELTILGDVQMEVEKIPSGSRVIVGEKGVFRVPSEADLRRDYHKVVVTESAGHVAYDYCLDDEKVRPAFAAEPSSAEPGEKPFDVVTDEQGRVVGFKLCVGNVKPDLYYEFRRSDDLKAWTVVQRLFADGREGAVVFEAPASGEKGFYNVAVSDDPTPAFSYESYYGGVRITGSTLLANDSFGGKLVIPAQIGGKSVLRIAEEAFKNRTDITIVDMPDTVQTIGYDAFRGCANLRSVRMSAGVTYIAGSAFRDCSSLETLELPQGLEELVNYCFAGTAIKHLTLPSSVKKIGSFDTAPGASLALEWVRFMGDPPESYPLALNLPTTCIIYVQHNKYAWGDVPRIWEGYRLEFWVDFSTRANADGTLTITGNGPLGGHSLAIPAMIGGKRVTAIDDAAFIDCAHISTVTLPEGVERIGNLAFSGMTNMKHIELPASLAYLGASAFGAAPVMEEVVFRGDSPEIGGEQHLNTAKCVIRVAPGTTGWGAIPGTWQGCPLVNLD